MNQTHPLDHLLSTGYVVLEQRYDANTCDRMLSEGEWLFERYRDLASLEEFVFDAGKGNDHSIYGVENAGREVKVFSEDSGLKALVNQYVDQIKERLGRREKSREDDQLIKHLIDARGYRGNYEIFDDRPEPYDNWLVKLTALSHRRGRMNNSGGDWHRDSLYPGLKAILFLNEVSAEHGPLQLYPRSRYYLDDNALCAARNQHQIQRGSNTKYSGHRLRYHHPDIEPATLTVTPGTVVLFDTSLIHRGKPIESGRRWTLSNYYFKGSPDIANLGLFQLRGWKKNYIEFSDASN